VVQRVPPDDSVVLERDIDAFFGGRANKQNAPVAVCEPCFLSRAPVPLRGAFGVESKNGSRLQGPERSHENRKRRSSPHCRCSGEGLSPAVRRTDEAFGQALALESQPRTVTSGKPDKYYGKFMLSGGEDMFVVARRIVPAARSSQCFGDDLHLLGVNPGCDLDGIVGVAASTAA
jgi:hypothetical protein